MMLIVENDQGIGTMKEGAYSDSEDYVDLLFAVRLALIGKTPCTTRSMTPYRDKFNDIFNVA
jgi:hypothetical protein